MNVVTVGMCGLNLNMGRLKCALKERGNGVKAYLSTTTTGHSDGCCELPPAWPAGRITIATRAHVTG